MSIQQPFKFRHLDSIVGAFVIAAVAIVIAALALIGSARQWFTSSETISAETLPYDSAQAEFIEELAEGLRPGTPVELSGKVVGKVLSAEPDGGRLHLQLEVSKQALGNLHPDARAVIKVPLAPFMGQTRVLLKAGKTGGAGPWPTGKTLLVDQPRDSTRMALMVLQDLQTNLSPMMLAITGLVTESRKLVEEVRAQRLPQQTGELIAGLRERQVPQRLDGLLTRIEAIAALAEATAGDAKRISGGLVAGKGIAGKALADVQLDDDLTHLASDLRAITSELRKAAPTAPALAEGASTLLDEVQRLVDGLNRHWMLRSYTGTGNSERIVPPGIIGAPEARP